MQRHWFGDVLVRPTRAFALSLSSRLCPDDSSVWFVHIQQKPRSHPAEWHDLDLYWTIVCATALVSDDYNSLVCAVSVACSCADDSSLCVLCEINRALYSNSLSGTISTFIGQLTALTYLLVTITFVPFALSLCSCSCSDNSSVCFVK